MISKVNKNIFKKFELKTRKLSMSSKLMTSQIKSGDKTNKSLMSIKKENKETIAQHWFAFF